MLSIGYEPSKSSVRRLVNWGLLSQALPFRGGLLTTSLDMGSPFLCIAG